MRKVTLGLGLGLSLAACGGGDGGGQDGPGGGPDAMIGTGTPTAFRFTDMDLRDPHIYVQILACDDLTDSGAFVVNDEIQAGIENDQDDPPDGLLVAIGQLASLLQLVLQPLTACIAASAYLMLRSRVEGLDLEQRRLARERERPLPEVSRAPG